MGFRRSFVSAALHAAIIVFPLSAPVQAAPAPVQAVDKYIDGQGARFETLAGSRNNLASLASGLRMGREVTLAEQTKTGPRVTTFKPATKPMGYGNVTRSLDLANRQLASLGISDPSAAQLKSALNGGTVTTARGDVRLDGVLRLRSQGMGWGKIAHTVGVSPSGKANAKAASHAAAPVRAGDSKAPGTGRNSVAMAGGSSFPGASGVHGHDSAFPAAGGSPGPGGGHASGRGGK